MSDTEHKPENQAPVFGLSANQRDCLCVVQKLCAQSRPSLTEIAVAMGRKSTGPVHSLLCQLRERGHITWTPGARRSIVVLVPIPEPVADPIAETASAGRGRPRRARCPICGRLARVGRYGKAATCGDPACISAVCSAAASRQAEDARGAKGCKICGKPRVVRSHGGTGTTCGSRECIAATQRGRSSADGASSSVPDSADKPIGVTPDDGVFAGDFSAHNIKPGRSDGGVLRARPGERMSYTGSSAAWAADQA